MADRFDADDPDRTDIEQPPPANRAERRAKGKTRPPLPHGNGKVRPVRFDHATDPRQFAAHRRG